MDRSEWLQWLFFPDRPYVVDMLCSCAMWFLSRYISTLTPFERDFDHKDPLINHKHRPNTIGGEVNLSLVLFLPMGLTVAVAALRRSPMEIYHSLLGIISASALTNLTTEFLKNRVGRLRPDFLDRCKWDKDLKACTGKLDSILEGRRSFPSGHSSMAFCGMMFLSLWIATATGAWRITETVPGGAFHRSKIVRLVLSLAPLAFATWVAVSRLEDYRHHKEDVIVGSLIGIVCATICYHLYWASPFSAQPYGPRALYDRGLSQQHVGPPPADDPYGYELAGMGNEHAEQSV
ncbi:lipid phosphate phosphatase 1 [Trametes sanguinea]|nr:lipid phosphate phosphatase 1 [Trametes sanguinea]